MWSKYLWAEIVSVLRDSLRLAAFLTTDLPESKRPRQRRGRSNSTDRR